jgi:GNAT superfamily N-acetyltransferase
MTNETMSDLARRALAVNDAFFVLGNESFEAEGGTFIRNRDVPIIWDANHVTAITASTAAEIGRLLERADREFEGLRHRRFNVDARTPPEFEARMALEGYERRELLLLLLEGEVAGSPKPFEVREVTDEAAWRQYGALNDLDASEYAERLPDYSPEVASYLLELRKRRAPPVRHWMPIEDGAPRGYLSSWTGLDGVGFLEDLFTQIEYRRRGLATALIRHCVAEVRREGAGPVVIGADPADTPKRMYAALGFRPVATVRAYLKRLKDETNG